MIPGDSVSALLVGEFHIQDRIIFREVFRKRGWRLLESQDRNRAMLCLDCDNVQVVVVEFHPQDSAWKTLLQDLQRRRDPPQLVVTSRTADNSLWAEVLNLGGYDLLVSQPLDGDELERVLASAARHAGIPPAREDAAPLRRSCVA
jgi:response regulator RpfG family c-di-GMP phosphodiesterase